MSKIDDIMHLFPGIKGIRFPHLQKQYGEACNNMNCHQIKVSCLNWINAGFDINELVNQHDDYKRTIFHYACLNGDLMLLQMLCSLPGINLEVAFSNKNPGFLPLHAACMQGHLPIIQYMERELRGKFRNLLLQQDANQRSPLYLTLKHLEVFSYLINLYPLYKLVFNINDLVNQNDENGITIFHHICFNGDRDLPLMQYLCTLPGIDLELALSNRTPGFLPLHVACLEGHLPIIKYMHSVLGDKFKTLLDAKNFMERSPVDLALSRLQHHVVDYLLKFS